MRRTALALTATLSLSLVACNSGSDSSEGGTITPAEGTPTTEAGSSEGDQVQFNEPFEISQMDDNDVFMSISEITVGEDCRFGTYVPDYRSDQLGEDLQYLQVFAEVDVQKLDNPQSGGVVYLESPKTVDSEGFAKEADPAFDCQAADGYEDWFVPTDPGDKSRRYGAFIVPRGITEVRIENRVYQVQQ